MSDEHDLAAGELLELLGITPERLFERGPARCVARPLSYRSAVLDVLAWMDQQAAAAQGALG